VAVVILPKRRVPSHAEVVELGRHAILRGWWGNPWGFESPLRHYSAEISASFMC
jgi:hypothetical protein